MSVFLRQFATSNVLSGMTIVPQKQGNVELCLKSLELNTLRGSNLYVFFNSLLINFFKNFL